MVHTGTAIVSTPAESPCSWYVPTLLRQDIAEHNNESNNVDELPVVAELVDEEDDELSDGTDGRATCHNAHPEYDPLPFLWGSSVYDQLYVPVRVDKRKRRFVPPQLAVQGRIEFERQQTMRQTQELQRQHQELQQKIEQQTDKSNRFSIDYAKQDTILHATQPARSQAFLSQEWQEFQNQQRQVLATQPEIETLLSPTATNNLPVSFRSDRVSQSVLDQFQDAEVEITPSKPSKPTAAGQFDDDEDDPTLFLVENLSEEPSQTSPNASFGYNRHSKPAVQPISQLIRHQMLSPPSIGGVQSQLESLQFHSSLNLDRQVGSMWKPPTSNIYSQLGAQLGSQQTPSQEPLTSPRPIAEEVTQSTPTKKRAAKSPPSVSSETPQETTQDTVESARKKRKRDDTEDSDEHQRKPLSRQEALGRSVLLSVSIAPLPTAKGKEDSNSPWLAKFAELKRYCKKHGNCNVPVKFPSNPGLSRWVRQQRYQYKLYKQGRIPNSILINPERLELLETIDFAFNYVEDEAAKRWEYGFKLYTSFANDPDRAEWTSLELGRWIREQRKAWKLVKQGLMAHVHILSKDRLARLKQIKFDFGPEYDFSTDKTATSRKQSSPRRKANPDTAPTQSEDKVNMEKPPKQAKAKEQDSTKPKDRAKSKAKLQIQTQVQTEKDDTAKQQSKKSYDQKKDKIPETGKDQPATAERNQAGGESPTPPELLTSEIRQRVEPLVENFWKRMANKVGLTGGKNKKQKTPPSNTEEEESKPPADKYEEL